MSARVSQLSTVLRDRRAHALLTVLLAAGLLLGVFLWPASARITAMKVDNSKVSLIDSLNGGPVFQLANFKPGDEGAGEVTLSNNGILPASLVLTLNGIVDTPGANGGPLSQVLALTVLDVTDAGHPKQLYHGGFVEGQAIDAGSLGRDGSHTFRFVVTFPDGGAPPSETEGDNAFQGSKMTVNFTWTADGQDVDDDDDDPADARPPQQPASTPQPAGPTLVVPVGSGSISAPSSRRCLSRRRFAIRVREPRARRLRSARVTVNGRTFNAHRRHGRLVALVDLRSMPKGKVRVQIVARTRAGRRLSGSRVYATCTVKHARRTPHGRL